MLDAIDRQILERLALDGRVTWADLGGLLGLSAPAAADRVRRLQERGVIRHFTAVLDPDAIGLGLTAFVAVTLRAQYDYRTFIEGVVRFPEVVECHHVTGDDDFLLKVRCRSTRELELLLTERLKTMLQVGRTRTTVVLSTAKEGEGLVPPVEDRDEDDGRATTTRGRRR